MLENITYTLGRQVAFANSKSLAHRLLYAKKLGLESCIPGKLPVIQYFIP